MMNSTTTILPFPPKAIWVIPGRDAHDAWTVVVGNRSRAHPDICGAHMDACQASRTLQLPIRFKGHGR